VPVYVAPTATTGQIAYPTTATATDAQFQTRLAGALQRNIRNYAGRKLAQVSSAVEAKFDEIAVEAADKFVAAPISKFLGLSQQTGLPMYSDTTIKERMYGDPSQYPPPLGDGIRGLPYGSNRHYSHWFDGFRNATYTNVAWQNRQLVYDTFWYVSSRTGLEYSTVNEDGVKGGIMPLFAFEYKQSVTLNGGYPDNNQLIDTVGYMFFVEVYNDWAAQNGTATYDLQLDGYPTTAWPGAVKVSGIGTKKEYPQGVTNFCVQNTPRPPVSNGKTWAGLAVTCRENAMSTAPMTPRRLAEHYLESGATKFIDYPDQTGPRPTATRDYESPESDEANPPPAPITFPRLTWPYTPGDILCGFTLVFPGVDFNAGNGDASDVNGAPITVRGYPTSESPDKNVVSGMYVNNNAPAAAYFFQTANKGVGFTIGQGDGNAYLNCWPDTYGQNQYANTNPDYNYYSRLVATTSDVGDRVGILYRSPGYAGYGIISAGGFEMNNLSDPIEDVAAPDPSLIPTNWSDSDQVMNLLYFYWQQFVALPITANAVVLEIDADGDGSLYPCM
jgi:hypothetical protein